MGCSNASRIAEITQTEPTSRRSSIVLNKFSKFYDLKRKYTFISKIGKGAYGRVDLYADKASLNIQYAVKTISKYQLSLRSQEFIKNEVKILSSLDHPNIVKYLETFEDENFLQVVMEYVPGHNIFKELIKGSKSLSNQVHKNELTELKICEITYTLLKTLSFLHSRGIIHRDIKPENILWGDINDCSTLKIIDFGLSLNFNEDKGVQKAVGTPYYMAPEAIRGVFFPESDLWSIGVIMFIMVTGRHPFKGKSRKEIFKKILRGSYDKELLNKKSVSDNLKNLIENILIIDPTKRITVESTLKHKWFDIIYKRRKSLTYNVISSDILDSIQNFQNFNLFQKEILYYFAKISKDQDIKELKEAFMLIDTDDSGEIEYNQIPKIFKEHNIKLPDKQLKQIFNSLDFHSKGKVNYCEFIAATLPSLDYFDEEKLLSAFYYFDTNDCGYITLDSFVESLQQNNIQIKKEKLKTFFVEKGEDVKINFEDFKRMVYSNEN